MVKGSKKQLLDLLKKEGLLSLNDAVGKTDLAKSTLREHLLQLEDDGYVKRKFHRSGPGRPSLCYELTAKGHAVYPTYEPKLVKELIQYLKEEGEQGKLEAFFDRFWDQRLEEAKQRMEDSEGIGPKAVILPLIKMLKDEGFMPEYDMDTEGNQVTIKECNCPFGEVIKETRLPCKLEELFYKKLFGEQAKRISHMAEGDYTCTYEFPAKF
jgi:predicted ArsR family transcriptional regulator